MWKKIRILILLLILFIVAVNAYRDQNQDWNKPVRVLLHPVNADGQDSTQLYIQQLSNSSFQTVQQYLQQAAAQYRQQPVYFYLQLGRELKQLPPQVPEQASLLDSIIWSLKFRFYAWRQHQSVDGAPHVTLYLNYYDPAHQKALKHSTALEKAGLVRLTCLPPSVRTSRIMWYWHMNYCMLLAPVINMIWPPDCRFIRWVMPTRSNSHAIHSRKLS